MENYKFCFVIQPISDEKYNKRFDDVYKPVIEKAGLQAYRVDKDPAVNNIIEEIEKRISDSILCLADISIDNPNVWYELGYAYALGKQVVMVCDGSRSRFPFDISHKNIIPYHTDSPSDFNKLAERITERIKAIMATKKTSEAMMSSPLKASDGLQAVEKSLLAFMLGEQLSDNQTASIYILRNLMNKIGFTDTATGIAIRLLENRLFISVVTEQDWNGDSYSACKLTDIGVQFCLNHLEYFDLTQKKVNPDALPF